MHEDINLFFIPALYLNSDVGGLLVLTQALIGNVNFPQANLPEGSIKKRTRPKQVRTHTHIDFYIHT